MKQIKLLFGLIGICLLLGVTSCAEEDKSIFGDNFEIPELTDANTIQFTVDMTGDWRQLQVIGGGGRMAIEWGDGRLQKIADNNRKAITYKYGNRKTYQVRVWAEELDFCSIGIVLVPASNLRLGYLPKMKELSINSFSATSELNLSSSCPNVETINIGSCADLQRIDLSQCSKLQKIDIYTHPKLIELKLGRNPELTELYCYGNDILPSLCLKGLANLRRVNCGNNTLLSTIETDSEMAVNSLNIGRCAFQTLDFLSSFPLLNGLNCNSNRLTELDVSALTLLKSLDCGNNKSLTHLQISEPHTVNLILQVLNCSFCHLDKDELNTIFHALISYKPNQDDSDNFGIAFNNNPGTSECDRKIVEDKGWSVKESPGTL